MNSTRGTNRNVKYELSLQIDLGKVWRLFCLYRLVAINDKLNLSYKGSAEGN